MTVSSIFYSLGNGLWNVKDGALYKGDILFGDSTEENANKELMGEDRVKFDCTFHLPAYLLSPELAAKYAPIDYVFVNHSK